MMLVAFFLPFVIGIVGADQCLDVPEYKDEKGWKCSSWKMFNCGKAMSKYDYTKSGMSSLFTNCQYSCDTCGYGQDGCVDDMDFVDQKGFMCGDWMGHSCDTAMTRWRYSEMGQNNVMQNCKFTCGTCNTVEQKYMDCVNTQGMGKTCSSDADCTCQHGTESQFCFDFGYGKGCAICKDLWGDDCKTAENCEDYDGKCMPLWIPQVDQEGGSIYPRRKAVREAKREAAEAVPMCNCPSFKAGSVGGDIMCEWHGKNCSKARLSHEGSAVDDILVYTCPSKAKKCVLREGAVSISAKKSIVPVGLFQDNFMKMAILGAVVVVFFVMANVITKGGNEARAEEYAPLAV